MCMVGDAQFRIMCGMWGVDRAIKALNGMGMKASSEQIDAARKSEAEKQKQWDDIFRHMIE